MNRILITGTVGFIGAFLCKRLLETTDARVVGLDNVNDYYDVGIKKDRLRMLAEAAGGKAEDADADGFSCGRFEFVRGDLADETAVEELMGDLGRTTELVPIPNGSSDVGNVSYHCPTIQPQLSISDTFYALHTEQFRDETIKPKGHEAVAVGAQLIASLVYRTLTDAQFREDVQHSYEEQKEKKLNS